MGQQWNKEMITIFNRKPRFTITCRKILKKLMILKLFQGKNRDFVGTRVSSLYSALTFTFAFVSNYVIVVCNCNLLFFRFNFDSVFYLSPWPLISLNFVFYRSIQVHPVLAILILIHSSSHLDPMCFLCVNNSNNNNNNNNNVNNIIFKFHIWIFIGWCCSLITFFK